ncbi:MAG: ABC transporter permease subunit [Phycisphaerae bacterium]|nr:ABC transporter permease subunit [Phycisphaerae bacterium]
MLLFILRRLGQSVLTIFGVMVLTFLLFHVWVAGDIAASNINSPHPTEKQKADWRAKYGYNRPLLYNNARQIVVRDLTTGESKFTVIEDSKAGSNAVGALELTVDFGVAKEEDETPATTPTPAEAAETVTRLAATARTAARETMETARVEALEILETAAAEAPAAARARSQAALASALGKTLRAMEEASADIQGMLDAMQGEVLDVATLTASREMMETALAEAMETLKTAAAESPAVAQAEAKAVLEAGKAEAQAVLASASGKALRLLNEASAEVRETLDATKDEVLAAAEKEWPDPLAPLEAATATALESLKVAEDDTRQSREAIEALTQETAAPLETRVLEAVAAGEVPATPLPMASPVPASLLDDTLAAAKPGVTIRGRFVQRRLLSGDEPLTRDTPLAILTDEKSLTNPPTGEVRRPRAVLWFQTAEGRRVRVNLNGVQTAGDVLDRINNAPTNRDESTGRPLIHADITAWTPLQFFDSQFFHHLKKSATFQSRSFKTDKLLTETIRERARYSLALMIPVIALEFLLGLAIAAVVAYYRGRLIDRVGVFLSVLGMCVPMLAWMIYGQKLMELLAPAHAYGIFYRSNLYVPIAIMVLAGLGGIVRFYRTVILDETSRDYVRTARAKGVPLPGVLFKHVLKNCMLPILTQLILSLPFLILGSLLMESYFGIPGLGDLFYTSITSNDEPILTGLVFLTALTYTICLLLTDISYALFDPRVRLT